jgi:formylglycine-generating enzyme required for sulfatase activity
MQQESYTPHPMDTRDIELSAALQPLVEQMAKNVHEVWAQGRLDEGWNYGPVREDAAKHHPCLVPYESLPESEKEYDRNTSVQTLKLILKLGFKIEKGEESQPLKTSPKSKTHFTVNGVSFDMVEVEGGSFLMGSDDEEASGMEKPVHSETVSTFRMGKTVVTQALWWAVMENSPSYHNGDDLPVVSVSWNDCRTFISKLNSLTGENFRLPTEAEWEYAARGGNKSRGYKYSGSDSIDEVAWYRDNSGRELHPVGTKSPNELGIYDMNGNVMEWTSDLWCDDYNSSRESSNRVCRGGTWGSYARDCRVSVRCYDDPSHAYHSLGFRLAL